MDINQLFTLLSGISDATTLQTVIKDAKFVIGLFESKSKLAQVQAIVTANPTDPVAQQIQSIL